jgi:hypothetical protein
MTTVEYDIPERLVEMFFVTRGQQDKIDAWLDKIDPSQLITRRQLIGITSVPTLPPFPTLEFIFSRTSGIGSSLTVREAHTGQTLDVTDYDRW